MEKWMEFAEQSIIKVNGICITKLKKDNLRTMKWMATAEWYTQMEVISPVFGKTIKETEKVQSTFRMEKLKNKEHGKIMNTLAKIFDKMTKNFKTRI